MSGLFSLIFIICCVGIWYFIKKKPDKKMRNYSIIGVVVSVVLIAITNPNSAEKNSADSDVKTDQNASKDSADKEKEIQESKEKATQESKEKKERETKASQEAAERAAKEEAAKEEATKASIEAEKATPEGKVKSALKEVGIEDAKTKIDGNNVVISYPLPTAWSNDSMVVGWTGYLPDAVDLLKELKPDGFDNIIIQGTGKFTDQKGNESQDLAISSMFTKENLDSINFDNWQSQINSDGTIYYQVADAYYIHPGLFNDTKPETQVAIGQSGKHPENDFWLNYGVTTLE